MFPCRSFRVACLLSLLTPLSAADVLTVGPAGSGAQFTDIQVAIDAASDEDVILVRPGTYGGIVVDKPLKILGDGTGTVGISSAVIRDIAVGEELVLSGVNVGGAPYGSPTVLVQNCPGTVIFHGSLASSFTIPMRIEACARTMVLDSIVRGGGDFSSAPFFFSSPALSAQDSTIWIVDSTVEGRVGVQFGGDPIAGPGLHVVNSTLHAWRSSMRGGDHQGADCNCDAIVRGAPGIQAVGSTLDLFGGPTSEIIGGQGGRGGPFGSPDPGAPGVDLRSSSRARIQANIPIQGGLDGVGSNPAPPIQTDATSTFTLDPTVFPTLVSSVRHAQLGSTFSITLEGHPRGYQVLYSSLRTGTTKTYSGIEGISMLDRAHLFRISGGVLPASGMSVADVHVPSLMLLLGATFYFQTVERFPDHSPRVPAPVNRFAIGNPVLVTITQ